MKNPISLAPAVFLLLVTSALPKHQLAKPISFVSYDKDGNLVTATFTFSVPPQPPVMGFLPGRPYSAEEVTQDIRTLPDGTRVVRSNYTGMKPARSRSP